MSVNVFKNETRNQHFVSQSEQKLNSCSEDSHSKGANIYSFEKSGAGLELIARGKKRIEATLAFDDLFTILRIDKQDRINLEHLFQRYEGAHGEVALRFLDKISKLKSGLEPGAELRLEGADLDSVLDDIKLIYKFKVMNSIRNPFNIKRVLSVFSPFLSVRIDSPVTEELYRMISNKSEKESAYICSTYGLDIEEYRKWIELVVLFLYVEQYTDENFLDTYIDGFFSAKDLLTTVMIFHYATECVLLPDVAVAQDDVRENHIFHINVSKHCFITLQHTEIERSFNFELIDKDNPLFAEIKKHVMEALGGTTRAMLFHDNLDSLKGYNEICVKASKAHVFCAAPTVYGLPVVPG